MKKTLVLALSVLSAPVFAGEPVVYVAPTPAPAPSPLSWEVAIGYGVSHRDFYCEDWGGTAKNIDIITTDITAVYELDEKQSVNFRMGYGFGDEASRTWWGRKHETDVHMWTFMPGYRYTHALNEKAALYVGANFGLASVTVKDRERTPRGMEGAGETNVGFGYSVELGARYQVTDCCELFVAYEFLGSTANPKPSYDTYGWGPDSRDTHKQRYSVIRTGVNVKF